jgi:hypothetical protein
LARRAARGAISNIVDSIAWTRLFLDRRADWKAVRRQKRPTFISRKRMRGVFFSSLGGSQLSAQRGSQVCLRLSSARCNIGIVRPSAFARDRRKLRRGSLKRRRRESGKPAWRTYLEVRTAVYNALFVSSVYSQQGASSTVNLNLLKAGSCELKA